MSSVFRVASAAKLAEHCWQHFERDNEVFWIIVVINDTQHRDYLCFAFRKLRVQISWPEDQVS